MRKRIKKETTFNRLPFFEKGEKVQAEKKHTRKEKETEKEREETGKKCQK